MAQLRAGLIGLGAMGRNHARVLSALEGVEFVGAVDPDQVESQLLWPVVADLSELLALGIDYCVVAAPTVLHERLGLQLAAAGVHALIEKPLASTSRESKNLAQAFGEQGLIAGVGHIERYNPALQQARSRLAQGDLGEVYQVATRRQGPFPSRISDVGVVMDLATHDIDLTAWVTQQHYSTVAARTAHRSGREHEDLVTVVGTLAGGAVASHLVSWLSPLKERVTVITGERGTFVCDTLGAELTFHANGRAVETWDDLANFRGVTQGDVIRFAFDRPEPLRVEHEQFRDAVLGKQADIVTIADGAQTVMIAEACLASAREGTTVAVPHPPTSA
ncbi:Gfo/Idh/MocA family protein [Nocardioides sp. cx-173]|uniref:Gfo/Idh/MocA family protein n=1 Tax=Nocardioides sp. cx-173 TaxID=2898796 RepID=UPI001E619958|nr:Gfo/Idh/MocA family oxidoreductase [Nocardioides sp. cx-173]MCD4523769.1 Gfo/Idh/MocA family oxidoreductase [Nocardioides sp. cx-173]UGB41907.1 Gfo/Idh/MocA family oxidoreductase [Nocardioides sp. cx-173]